MAGAHPQLRAVMWKWGGPSTLPGCVGTLGHRTGVQGFGGEVVLECDFRLLIASDIRHATGPRKQPEVQRRAPVAAFRFIPDRH